MSGYLNEMLVKENGAYYYVLPVNINKKVMLKTKDESEFVRKYYAKEILGTVLKLNPILWIILVILKYEFEFNINSII